MIDRQVGKQHGTGKKSDAWSHCGRWAAMAWMMSELVSRVSGSKVRCRPEWVTGWNDTDRTAGWARPCSMIAPSSWSLSPRSTAATRVTVSPTSAQLSNARRLISRRSWPRISRWVRSSKPSNCR